MRAKEIQWSTRMWDLFTEAAEVGYSPLFREQEHAAQKLADLGLVRVYPWSIEITPRGKKVAKQIGL